MNIWSKSLFFTFLLIGTGMQASEVELKKDAAAVQEKLDVQLYDAVACANTKNVEQLLSQKANPNCDFPSIRRDTIYAWARRPLVIAVCNLAACIQNKDITEDALKERSKSHLAIVRLLLENKANPNVTMSPTTDSRLFEKHVAFTYTNRHLSAPKITPAYQALALLLAHGATTDLDSFTLPYGIHGLAEDDPALQNILKEHAAKAYAEIAGATSLAPDTTGLVVRYLV